MFLTVSQDNEKNKRIRRTAITIALAVYLALFIYFVEGARANGQKGFSQQFIAKFSGIYFAVLGVAFLIMRKYLPISGTTLKPVATDSSASAGAMATAASAAVDATTSIAG